MELERRKEAMTSVEGDSTLELLQIQRDALDPEKDPKAHAKAVKQYDDHKAKLERRARFLISEEGGGPGGGQAGGPSQEEAVDKFMKLGGAARAERNC